MPRKYTRKKVNAPCIEHLLCLRSAMVCIWLYDYMYETMNVSIYAFTKEKESNTIELACVTLLVVSPILLHNILSYKPKYNFLQVK